MSEGADKIVKKILEDAKAKADAIKADTQEKARAVEEEAKQKAERKKEHILEQAHKNAEEHKRRIIGVAQLEARKDKLAAKQDLISDVFEQALKQLESMDDQSYFKVLQNLLLEHAETGEELVFCSAKDQGRIPDSFWQEVNDTLVKQGKKGELKPAETTRDIRGGFILQSEGVEINCSFEALLEMHRDELEPEVAAVLFQ